MVCDIVCRNFLEGVGAAGTAGLTGLSGCIGDGGGSGGPEGLVVTGYPESGTQLFCDHYSASDGSEEILVPDGMRSGSMPGQIGNDMVNVTGTAPVAGGPNQDTFNQLFEDEYGTAPGVFTSQIYDSVAIQLLSNVAAGGNPGPAIEDQMCRMANPGGVTVGPDSPVEGIETAANGEDIDYQGASSSVNFDKNDDSAEAAYSIREFDAENNVTSSVETQSFAGENFDGDGSSVDSGPGGPDRETLVGILLPEAGDLTAVGVSMIQVVQIPVM